jgi:hypothetical protein
MSVVLDPSLGKILIYRDPSNSVCSLKESISLLDVKEVSIVEKPLWWMKKNYVYIQLVGKWVRYFMTKYDNIAVKWVNCIQIACWYIKNTDGLYLADNNQCATEIELNSKTNTITVSKRTSRKSQKTSKHLGRRDKPLINYTLIKQIGEGAFANILLAKHKDTDRLYAIKVINKKQLVDSGQLRYAYSEIEIFERIKHPFIVEMLENFESQDLLYMVLEYCPYGNLSEYLCETGVLSEAAARELVAQIVLAI